jgi:methionyl-tRNA formyltransferase
MPLRLIFMGTPDFAVPTLLALHAAGHEIVAVYTRAPKPGGRRGLDLTPTPVEREAEKLGFKVLTPKTLRDAEAQAEFAAFKADAAVVVAYGLILPKAVLEAPRLGCFNVHASLLPRWRGAAPIHRAVMAGDANSGVSIMKMDEGLDTGKVAKAKRVPIGDDMTAGELHDILADIGSERIVSALDALERKTIRYKRQPKEGVTYAEKISKSESRIDWSRRAREVHNHIRGLSPFPGAWFEFDGARVKVLHSTLGSGSAAPGTALDDHLTIACSDRAVRLIQVQREGKKAMSAEEFLRGTALRKGTVVS